LIFKAKVGTKYYLSSHFSIKSGDGNFREFNFFQIHGLFQWPQGSILESKSTNTFLNSINIYENNHSKRSFAALKPYDEIEEIYISNMDFLIVNRLTDELITLFYNNDSISKEPKVKHKFLGAATPSGAVDFIQNLQKILKCVISLKVEQVPAYSQC
jgi:hypothetical protein